LTGIDRFVRLLLHFCFVCAGIRLWSSIIIRGHNSRLCFFLRS
uniref:Ovule protein n=1 Tax=Haemonchus placei TaxID=6290 RepID=A0A0N4X651_HAEPC